MTTDKEGYRNSPWPGSFSYRVPERERCSVPTGHLHLLPVLWQNEESYVYIYDYIRVYFKTAFFLFDPTMYILLLLFWQIKCKVLF